MGQSISLNLVYTPTIFTHGRFPEVGQKQKTERKRKKKEKRKKD